MKGEAMPAEHLHAEWFVTFLQATGGKVAQRIDVLAEVQSSLLAAERGQDGNETDLVDLETIEGRFVAEIVQHQFAIERETDRLVMQIDHTTDDIVLRPHFAEAIGDVLMEASGIHSVEAVTVGVGAHRIESIEFRGVTPTDQHAAGRQQFHFVVPFASIDGKRLLRSIGSVGGNAIVRRGVHRFSSSTIQIFDIGRRRFDRVPVGEQRLHRFTGRVAIDLLDTVVDDRVRNQMGTSFLSRILQTNERDEMKG